MNQEDLKVNELAHGGLKLCIQFDLYISNSILILELLKLFTVCNPSTL